MVKFTSETKDLLLFFFIAFIWSWLFWFPEVLWDFRLYVAPFGPTLAAFIMTYLRHGLNGMKTLFKRGFEFRFNKIWFIPIFFLMPLIVGLSLVLAILTDGLIPNIPVLSQPWIIIPAFFYVLFLGGPVAEEFGWRGYALDRLQARYNALISSMILGALWGLWHLPLFFMKNQDIYRDIPILFFVIGTIFLSILFTWIYNNTNRSILSVLLFHTIGNLSHFIFPAMATTWGGLYSVILNMFVVIVILVIWGPKKMVRGNHDNALCNN